MQDNQVEQTGQTGYVVQAEQHDREQESKSTPSKSSPSDAHESDLDDQKSEHRQLMIQSDAKEGDKPVRDSHKRYKYCCKKCKHTERNKKACVCVVPMSQRITQLGDHGCQSCGCKGCSFEDFISRGEDPEYRPNQWKAEGYKEYKGEVKSCCPKCKSCICQQPSAARRGKIPGNGCKMCGCQGCTTEDRKDQGRNRGRSSRSRSRDRRRKQYSDEEDSQEKVDPIAMNFNNFDRSIIGTMINDWRVYPYLLGFGVPQRTQSYIIGRPK